MNASVDVACRVSPALSEILEAQADHPEAIQPATLGSVRAALVGGGLAEVYDADRLHPQTARSILSELDDLIEEFGEEAAARDFVVIEASLELSSVIQSVIDGASRPPTLESVQEAMGRGLVARLVGEGAIDPDDDETLQEELANLIRRYGPHVPAECFLRYE